MLYSHQFYCQFWVDSSIAKPTQEITKLNWTDHWIQRERERNKMCILHTRQNAQESIDLKKIIKGMTEMPKNKNHKQPQMKWYGCDK